MVMVHTAAQDVHVHDRHAELPGRRGPAKAFQGHQPKALPGLVFDSFLDPLRSLPEEFFVEGLLDSPGQFLSGGGTGDCGK